MWKRATAGLSDDQFEMIFTFCLDRCMNGNPWPPELSDVIVMLSDKLVDSNAFGIPFDDMLRDFNKYMAKRGYYSSAEMYPFRHPVQYWIFTDLRNKVHDLRLTDPEVEKRLAKMIRQWADRVAKGEPIPRPVLRMEDKTRPGWKCSKERNNDLPESMNHQNRKPAQRSEVLTMWSVRFHDVVLKASHNSIQSVLIVYGALVFLLLKR